MCTFQWNAESRQKVEELALVLSSGMKLLKVPVEPTEQLEHILRAGGGRVGEEGEKRTPICSSVGQERSLKPQ